MKKWNHRPGGPGQHASRLTAEVRDRILKLQRNPLFKYSKCISEKFHKHKKGHREKCIEPKPIKMLQMDYGFLRGNKHVSSQRVETFSRDTEPDNLPLKSFRN